MNEPGTEPAGARRPRGKGRVAERVVEELRAYIADNDLRPGDRLPPERVFMELLSVSRSSLREAVRVLSAMGCIEVVHGDGMYVTANSADGETGKAMFDTHEEHALRNLVETRLGVELAAVTALTRRGTAADSDALAAMLDEQGAKLREDGSFVWEPLAFELAIASMSGNTWLCEIEERLRDAWVRLSSGLKATVGRHGEWHAEHLAILASMRSGNVAQAQRLVMAHLSLERFESDLARRSRAGRSPGRRKTAGGDR
jgi:GntR family transcriptional repressor for pyruvate dehydrogenase complex